MICKRTYVTPVYKGSKQDISNYRLCKLCFIVKVFERLVYNQLYVALAGTFSPSQHGFLMGRCTIFNLVLLNDFVTNGMNNGFQVDVDYTDYTLRLLIELGTLSS